MRGDGERRGVRPTDLVSLGALTTLAELLWRISASLRLDHLRDLPDGFWLALITKPRLRTSRKERLRAAAPVGDQVAPLRVRYPSSLSWWAVSFVVFLSNKRSASLRAVSYSSGWGSTLPLPGAL